MNAASPIRRVPYAAMVVLVITLAFVPALATSGVFAGNCDIFLHVFGAAFLADSLVHAHALPLWTHHINGGYPLYANPEFAFPDPIALLAALAGDVLGTKLRLLVWLIAAGLAFFTFMRDFCRVRPPIAAFLAVAFVYSPWAGNHFFAGGDINDTAFYLFPMFLAAYHRFLDRDFYAAPRRPLAALAGGVIGGEWSRWAALSWFVFFFGAALASGKGHMINFMFVAALYAGVDAARFALRRDARALAPLAVFAAACLLPLVLFRSRVVSSANLAYMISASVDFDYGISASAGRSLAALVASLSRSLFDPFSLWVPILALALFLGIGRARDFRLPVVLAVTLVLMLGDATPLGKALFRLPLLRTTAGWKYWDGYVFYTPLLLLARGLGGEFRHRVGRWLCPLALALVAFGSIAPLELLAARTSTPLPTVTRAPAFANTLNTASNRNAPYFFYRANLGTLNWLSSIYRPSEVSPTYTHATPISGLPGPDNAPYCGFPAPGDLRPNPGYRGEAYFDGDANRVLAVAIGANRLVVTTDVADAPAHLFLNTNYSPHWSSDDADVRRGKGNLLTALVRRPGRQTVTLVFRDARYARLVAWDTAVFATLALLGTLAAWHARRRFARTAGSAYD